VNALGTFPLKRPPLSRGLGSEVKGNEVKWSEVKGIWSEEEIDYFQEKGRNGGRRREVMWSEVKRIEVKGKEFEVQENQPYTGRRLGKR